MSIHGTGLIQECALSSYSVQYTHVDLHRFCFVLSGRGAAAGLRGPGAQSGCGDTDHERRAGKSSLQATVLRST